MNQSSMTKLANTTVRARRLHCRHWFAAAVDEQARDLTRPGLMLAAVGLRAQGVRACSNPGALVVAAAAC